MYCCCGTKRPSRQNLEQSSKDAMSPAPFTNQNQSETPARESSVKSPESVARIEQLEIEQLGVQEANANDRQPSFMHAVGNEEMINPIHIVLDIASPVNDQPPSLNRESTINKAPALVEMESQAIRPLGLSTVEKIAGQMVARYSEDATLEEFMANVSSVQGHSQINVPLTSKTEIENPLLRRGNWTKEQGLSESKVKERKKKVIKDKLSTIKSVFCKEIISDIIYDNKEKEISFKKTIPQCLFMLRGKSIMKHLFSFLGTEDKLNLLLAVKFKVAANKDSSLLFLCLCKAALAFELPNLLYAVQWQGTEATSIKEIIRSNIEKDSLLRYISLFINVTVLDIGPVFAQYVTQPYAKIAEIDKDVTRTFPDYFSYGNRRMLLREVLSALSTSTPTIGYVQGINAITGAIMIYFDNKRVAGGIESNPQALQHLTFTLVKFMLERRSLSLMYERSLYGFGLLCLEIKLWVKVLHPDLYQYLVDDVD